MTIYLLEADANLSGGLVVILGVTMLYRACFIRSAGGVNTKCSNPMESLVWPMPPT